MAIRQCANHHFYDDEKFEVCPVCLLEQQQGTSVGDETVGYTVPLEDEDDVTRGLCLLEADSLAKPVVG